MNFLNKIIIILSLSLFSATAFSAESDCGLNKNGTIDQTNISICEDDILLNVYKTVFPIIFTDTIFNFFEFDYIENEESSKNNFSFLDLNKHKIIVGISTIINTALMLFVFFIVAKIIYLALTGTSRDGSFLGEGYNGKKMAYGFGAFTVLLAPIGSGITVLQFLTMSLSILSISLANGILAFYLNFVSGDFFYNTQKEISSYEVSKMDNNSKIYAYKFASALISGSLCNRISSQYVFENSFSTISPENIGNNIDCVFANDGFGLKINTVDSGELISGVSSKSYTVSPLSLKNVDYINTSLTFGRNGPLTGSCSTYNNFNCLNINISLPAISDPQIQDMVNNSNLIDVYRSTVQSLSIGADNYGKIKSGWDTIASEVYAVYADNNGVLTINEERALKALSLFYHQLVQNYFMLGYLEVNNVGGTLSPQNINLESINGTMQKVESIVDLLERGNCSLSGYGASNSYETSEYLNSLLSGGQTDINSSYKLSSMRCIKYTGDSFVSQMDKKYNFSVEGDGQLAYESGNSYNKKAIDEFNNLVKDLANTRVQVNKSFQKSLSEINSEEFFVKIRQRGILALGFFGMEIAKKNDIDGKFRKYIDKESFNVDANFNIAKVISKDILSDSIRNHRVDNYGSFDILAEINDYINDINPLIDSESTNYISNVVNELGDGKVSDEEYKNTITKALWSVTDKFLNIEESLMGATGARLIFGTKEDMISGYEDCIVGEEECARMVTQNPVIRLNEFGHDLINSSVVIAGSLGVASWMADNIANFASNKYMEQLSGGISSGKSGKAKMLISAGSSAIMSSLGAIIELLLFLVVLLAAFGFILAYLIPLMPMIKYLVEIISWLMLSILAFFIANMWAVFMISPPKEGEGKNLIMNTIYNYVVQLVFRLPLITIAYIIVWSLLTVFIMLLNFVFSSVANSLITQSSDILFLLTMFLILTSYVFIVYVVFKFTVNLLDYIPKKVTEKMGVDSNPSDAGMAALIMAKSNKPLGNIKGSAKRVMSLGKVKK